MIHPWKKIELLPWPSWSRWCQVSEATVVALEDQARLKKAWILEDGAPVRSQIAKLVSNLTPISLMAYGTQITIATGVYKPSCNVWGQHIVGTSWLFADFSEQFWVSERGLFVTFRGFQRNSGGKDDFTSEFRDIRWCRNMKQRIWQEFEGPLSWYNSGSSADRSVFLDLIQTSFTFW